MMNRIEIILEDTSVIVCHKPAGIATQTRKLGEKDVVSELKSHLAKKTKEKDPYLGIIHRLDQPVEGILVFAKTKKAAAFLSKELVKGDLCKHYYALVLGLPIAEEGVLKDYLVKDNKLNKANITLEKTPGAKKAELHYLACGHAEGVSMYDITIETGRFHQIRAQMAHAGMSLLGDMKYADDKTIDYSKEHNIKQVCLCAYEMSFIHPETKKEIFFSIIPEGEQFKNFFR